MVLLQRIRHSGLRRERERLVSECWGLILKTERSGGSLFHFVLAIKSFNTFSHGYQHKKNKQDGLFSLTGESGRRIIADRNDEGQPMCLRSHRGCPFEKGSGA